MGEGVTNGWVVDLSAAGNGPDIRIEGAQATQGFRAAGAVEHVPIAVVGGLPTALKQMRDAGIWVVGLDDAADRSLFDLGELAAEAVCLVLGAEGAGLSRLVRERCDMIVSIPMRGRLGSLNVSAAAALATYEVARYRRGTGA
jgi:23S rRNA (guanosine2251-2'-O)-methyltransferase